MSIPIEPNKDEQLTKEVPIKHIGKGRKVTVFCNGDLFSGRIIGETTSHYLVTHRGNTELGELFAKNSDRVWCKL